MKMNLIDKFDHMSEWIADSLGKPLAFVVAVVLVLIWALSGPLFHYDDTWQLIVNTATTVLTFLMLFVLQNTQNRDTRETYEDLKLLMDQQKLLLQGQRRLSERLRYLEFQLSKKSG